MDSVTGHISKGNVPDLQSLLDAVPAERTVACLPTRDYLILHDGEKELGRIPLERVVEVSLLDDSSVHKRYPIGRSLLLGPLVFLFPQRTLREAYRLCIQWKSDDDYQFTYIRIARKITAEQMLHSLKHALKPEVRSQPAQKAPKPREQNVVPDQEQPLRSANALFITCRYCTMEFRKTDLPPGGKCPVCGKALSGLGNDGR
ncbi:MAG: hypothetical protein CVU54_14200 [Deltaproteobacteria bacterium HGW-Deltaproteobacteria-12]|jgi:hypothetical protein|nr:MAG: hypothetical protein CVU54_14200 [Deltaproteobacteria bacterium HGW-Deltaproteobacteria-12]